MGRFELDDRYCIECPTWVRNRCITTTPGAQEKLRGGDATLEALKQRLKGV